MKRILQNRYRLLHLVGQGAMGQVYAAEDIALGGIPVAVKFLAQTLLNQKMRERFEREAKTCAQLGQRNLHIVRVTDYGIDEEGIPFYVMEYLNGESLSEVINHRPLPLPRFLHLSRQICLGLQCAHQGILIDGRICPIVHRDIKPSNILVSQDDSLGELVKILDFGIAKAIEAESSQTQCFMGTLAYSSPEQMEGHELDARADLYSLGVMMFQMLTGKMPLQADTHSFGGWYKAHHFQVPRSLAAVNPMVRAPQNLENLVMACLAKFPDDRPQSVIEILATLASLEAEYGASRPVQPQYRVPDAAPAEADNPAGSRSASDTAGSSLVLDSELHRLSWPNNMPLAEIVFPRALPTPQGHQPTLWIMMPKVETQRRRTCTRYNQFLFLEAPHPMALWLTVLYNQGQEPRWLPCYLDLKTPQSRQIASLLGKAGQYQLLFFAQEEPQYCAYSQTASIAEAQCRLLREWALIGQTSRSAPNPGISKEHLKSALETIKPQILSKLDSIYAAEAKVV
jgi:serine/threonine-protein kinase